MQVFDFIAFAEQTRLKSLVAATWMWRQLADLQLYWIRSAKHELYVNALHLICLNALLFLDKMASRLVANYEVQLGTATPSNSQILGYVSSLEGLFA